MWQCVAVSGSVLQCVAVCCSVLQCVAMSGRVLQCVAVCCSVLQSLAGCCSAMRFVSMCGTLLQCAAVCGSVCWCVAMQCIAVCDRLQHALPCGCPATVGHSGRTADKVETKKERTARKIEHTACGHFKEKNERNRALFLSFYFVCLLYLSPTEISDGGIERGKETEGGQE